MYINNAYLKHRILAHIILPYCAIRLFFLFFSSHFGAPTGSSHCPRARPPGPRFEFNYASECTRPRYRVVAAAASSFRDRLNPKWNTTIVTALYRRAGHLTAARVHTICAPLRVFASALKTSARVRMPTFGSCNLFKKKKTAHCDYTRRTVIIIIICARHPRTMMHVYRTIISNTADCRAVSFGGGGAQCIRAIERSSRAHQ